MSAAASRLDDPRPGVRRVAILDLGREARRDPRGPGLVALVGHLRVERDGATARKLVAAIESLAGVAMDAPTRAAVAGALLRVYDDPGTPVGVAVAAIRAHGAVVDGGHGGG